MGRGLFGGHFRELASVKCAVWFRAGLNPDSVPLPRSSGMHNIDVHDVQDNFERPEFIYYPAHPVYPCWVRFSSSPNRQACCGICHSGWSP